MRVDSIPRIQHLLSSIFKDLLLQNHLATQKQISCGASMGRGKKVYIKGQERINAKYQFSVYKATGSLWFMLLDLSIAILYKCQ